MATAKSFVLCDKGIILKGLLLGYVLDVLSLFIYIYIFNYVIYMCVRVRVHVCVCVFTEIVPWSSLSQLPG